MLVQDICILYTSLLKRFKLPVMRASQQSMVDNFHRNAQGGHVVFQNEANFNRREAYLPMNTSCQFGEASWSCFQLRVLPSKIFLLIPVSVVVAYGMLNQGIHQIHPVDRKINIPHKITKWSSTIQFLN